MIIEVKNVTEVELLAEADELAARALGVSRQEAFRRLEEAQYSGTIFESKMAAIRFLLGAESD